MADPTRALRLLDRLDRMLVRLGAPGEDALHSLDELRLEVLRLEAIEAAARHLDGMPATRNSGFRKALHVALTGRDTIPRRTRYTCVAGSGEPVVKSAHPIGSELNCPYCGKRVTVGTAAHNGAAVMPMHNIPTKRERAAMKRANRGTP